MRTVYYTDYFKASSGIIDEVYYDIRNYELYVRLNNGTVCGYDEVEPETFKNFRDATSAGNYWNVMVKRFYPGLDGDVAFRASVDARANDRTPESREFVVTVHVEGDLKLRLDQPDALAAAQHVKEILSKAVSDGTIAFIKEVKIAE